MTIDFDVAKVGAKLKVKQFQWSTYSCNILTVNKAIAVSSKGKFTSKTKARVTVFDEDPNSTCGDPAQATVRLEK